MTELSAFYNENSNKFAGFELQLRHLEYNMQKKQDCVIARSEKKNMKNLIYSDLKHAPNPSVFDTH